MGEALAVKYRPQTFQEVVSQKSVITILQRQIDLKQYTNCYLFCGASGCGKTSIARIFAKAINNGKGRPIEIDGASNNGVDNIRSIIEDAQQRALDSEYKIFIVDEVHALSTNAWQAFLKCLEEPPMYTIFILCTTNPEKIPATILNRVMRFNLNRLSTEEIYKRLCYISQQEGFTNYEESCDYISKMCNGGARDAIAYLEKAASYSKQMDIYLTTEALGTISYKTLFSMINSIIDGNGKELFENISRIYNQGQNLVLLVDQLVDLTLNIEKYCIFQDISCTNIPSSLLDSLTYTANIDNNIDYFAKLSEELLSLKNMLKYDTNIYTTIEITLNKILRLGV